MNKTLDLSSPELRSKTLPAVDIGKFICALLVVAMHCNPLADFQPWLSFGLVHCLARIAVPFFFICSGYFCVRKASAQGFDPKIGYQYAWKVLKLYIIWNGVYLLQHAYLALTDANGIVAGIHSRLQLFFVAGYAHLWYLKALALAIALLTVALHKNIRLGAILAIAAGLYGIGLLGDSYYGLLAGVPALQRVMDWYLKIFLTTRNGLFEGFLFVAIGALFARKSITIKKPLALVGFVSSMGLMTAEAYTVRRFGLAFDYNMYIALVPAAFFLFYLLASVNMKESPAVRTLRLYSTWVYYLHPWVIFPVLSVVVKGIAIVLGKSDYAMPSLLQYSIALLGSLVATFLITTLQKYKPFSWLNKLGG